MCQLFLRYEFEKLTIGKDQKFLHGTSKPQFQLSIKHCEICPKPYNELIKVLFSQFAIFFFSGIREAFQSGDHEPWVFRGGLISDLLRLLPLDSGHDLYIYKYPEVPLSLLYLVRPYDPKDQKDVYALAAKLFEEEIEVPMGTSEKIFIL